MSAHSNTSANTLDCSTACNTSPQLQLFQSIIFATPALFACLLLVLFCMLYVRRRRDSYNAAQARAHLALEAFSLVAHSQGLSISLRQKLPIAPFNTSRECTQCAICLGEYQIDEKLQELPVCKHLFHISCIGEWLAENTTCPICRTSLSTDEPNDRPGELDRTGDDRRWEERVVNEAQDGNTYLRLDGPPRADSSGSRDSEGFVEITLHLNGEHAVNIERC